MAVLFDTGIFSVLTTGGAIDPGATLTWYLAGTTTPVDTFPTPAAALAGTPANANPVVADANGRFGQIWLNNGTYKYVLKSSAGSTLKTVDNLYADTEFAQATVAELWTGTATDKAVSPYTLYTAAALVSLTDATSIATDMNTGLNFKVTLGGNRTLANPTNAKVGQNGIIKITQDGTGSRTLAYGSAWKFPSGAPTLSTAAGTVDAISYYVDTTSYIMCTIARAFS